MNDYLPLAYRDFRATYPDVANTLDHLGHAADEAGPLAEKLRFRWARTDSLPQESEPPRHS